MDTLIELLGAVLATIIVGSALCGHLSDSETAYRAAFYAPASQITEY